MDVRAVHCAKALGLMEVSVAGSSICFNEAQPSNMPSDKYVDEEGNVTLAKETHPLNSPFPSWVQLSGMTMLSNDVQSPNALVATNDFSVSGSRIVFRLAHPTNWSASMVKFVSMSTWTMPRL